MQEGEIYIITNIINNKKYIGQTVTYLSSGRKYGFKQRWGKHVRDAKNNNDECRVFNNAIRKYGRNSFKVELLIKCNINLLDMYETKFIYMYNTITPNGYNIESGGTKGKIMNEDTKLKLSKVQRFLNVSEDDKEKIIKSMEELNITELPFGVNYTHHRKNNYEGFTVKKTNGKLKSIISNMKSLTEKLDLALRYNKFTIDNNINEIEKIDKELDILSKICIRNDKLSLDAKEVIKKINIDINTLPLNIRYDARNLRFFVNINSKNKYFKIRDPEGSLKEAIEYVNNLQKRELVLE